ncbi:MAG: GHKL domain-containing protein [Lachnospiraceae bacterium]|nr:GHKL domain-containing protein [Lachnospiraceae bacterium]
MHFTFWSVMAYNLIDAAFTYVGQVLLSRGLLQRKGNEKRTVFLSVPFCVLTALLASVIYINQGFSDIRVVLPYNYTNVFFWAVWIFLVYKETLLDAGAAASLTAFFYNVAISMTGFFFQGNADLSVWSELVFFALSDWILELFFAAVLAAGIRRFRLGEAYRQLFYESSFGNRWKIASLFLIAFWHGSVYLINEKKILNNDNPMAAMLLLLLVFCVLNYGSLCEAQKKQLILQESNIKQQETYITALEKIQKEVRMFRHDYKNMISGVLAHADHGDLKAVQEFLGDMAEHFERQTGEDIHRMAQLSKVNIPELKGLFLLKFSEMQRKEINCNLEVSPSIVNPGIPAYDLCRMVGILVDNAMEAVESLKEKKFDLVLTSSGECVSIVVKNPVEDSVPLQEIWKEGNSTKGMGRGLGLASLKRTARSYENVFVSTFLEKGCLIQELKIAADRTWEGQT